MELLQGDRRRSNPPLEVVGWLPPTDMEVQEMLLRMTRVDGDVRGRDAA